MLTASPISADSEVSSVILRKFLKTQCCSQYKNLDIEWISGHIPTAYFKNENGDILKEEKIGDRDEEQMFSFFEENGFKLIPAETAKSEL
eukprot:jgi/Bigna1/130018/aug1.10_g4726